MSSHPKPFKRHERRTPRHAAPSPDNATHSDDEMYDAWDRDTKRVFDRQSSRFLRGPIFVLIAVGVVTAIIAFRQPARKPAFVATMQQQKAMYNLADRKTALTLLELMEANRLEEALEIASGFATTFSETERDLPRQLQDNPGDACRKLEDYICTWIAMENTVATSGSIANARTGFPSAETSDNIVLFLCDYADYRTRNFSPASTTIHPEVLARIFMKSAQEKERRNLN